MVWGIWRSRLKSSLLAAFFVAVTPKLSPAFFFLDELIYQLAKSVTLKLSPGFVFFATAIGSRSGKML